MRKSLILAAFLSALALPSLAVQPGEQLADPALEARAREISRVLRCPVCQGENIDDSNAEISADLRKLVRARLVAGDSDSEVLDYVFERYGEYVLFEPPAKGGNWLLWLAGPLMLLGGGAVAWATLRSRRPEPQVAPLSESEAAEVEKILHS